MYVVISATVTVQIRVIGSSDKPPFFAPGPDGEAPGEGVSVAEGSALNTTVTTLVAENPDEGEIL